MTKKIRHIKLDSAELSELINRFRYHAADIKSDCQYKLASGAYGLRGLSLDLLALLIQNENKPISNELKKWIYDTVDDKDIGIFK